MPVIFSITKKRDSLIIMDHKGVIEFTVIICFDYNTG